MHNIVITQMHVRDRKRNRPLLHFFTKVIKLFLYESEKVVFKMGIN